MPPSTSKPNDNFADAASHGLKKDQFKHDKQVCLQNCFSGKFINAKLSARRAKLLS
jgi:hypothetical protein